jgi:ribosomal protein S16
MEKSDKELYEEAQARKRLAVYRESLTQAVDPYRDQVQGLQAVLQWIPRWRLIGRYQTKRRIGKAVEIVGLFDFAVERSLQYQDKVGKIESERMIKHLEELALWSDTVSVGKNKIMTDKARPLREAIAYLRGTKQAL